MQNSGTEQCPPHNRTDTPGRAANAVGRFHNDTMAAAGINASTAEWCYRASEYRMRAGLVAGYQRLDRLAGAVRFVWNCLLGDSSTLRQSSRKPRTSARHFTRSGPAECLRVRVAAGPQQQHCRQDRGRAVGKGSRGISPQQKDRGGTRQAVEGQERQAQVVQVQTRP